MDTTAVAAGVQAIQALLMEWLYRSTEPKLEPEPLNHPPVSPKHQLTLLATLHEQGPPA